MPMNMQTLSRSPWTEQQRGETFQLDFHVIVEGNMVSLSSCEQLPDKYKGQVQHV